MEVWLWSVLQWLCVILGCVLCVSVELLFWRRPLDQINAHCCTACNAAYLSRNQLSPLPAGQAEPINRDGWPSSQGRCSCSDSLASFVSHSSCVTFLAWTLAWACTHRHCLHGILASSSWHCSFSLAYSHKLVPTDVFMLAHSHWHVHMVMLLLIHSHQHIHTGMFILAEKNWQKSASRGAMFLAFAVLQGPFFPY